MKAVTHKGVMRFTIQNFTAGKKTQHCVIKWGFADRKRRDRLEKQPETQKHNCWGNAMDWNQTPRKKYSSMFCNWVSQFFLCSLKPFKWAYTLRIHNTLALWKARLWKLQQIRHQKSLVIIKKKKIFARGSNSPDKYWALYLTSTLQQQTICLSNATLS